MIAMLIKESVSEKSLKEEQKNKSWHEVMPVVEKNSDIH